MKRTMGWTAPASGDDILGYYVYRSPTPTGPYQRISPDLVHQTRFVDVTSEGQADVTYQVRAVVLQKSASGTYINLSQGLFSVEPTRESVP